MSENHERDAWLRGAIREMDERITALETRVASLEAREAKMLEFRERISQELARQAIELAGEIANQFAAARQGELGELTARVAKLEQWQDEMDVMPDNHADEEDVVEPMFPDGTIVRFTPNGQPQDWAPGEDDYEDPGPQSISPPG